MTREKLEEAHRLEHEARRLRTQVAAETQRRQMQLEQAFEQRTGIHLGVSSDYAVLDCGNLRFYYGYEYTVPPTSDYEDDDGEWAFVVWQDGDEVLRMPTSEVHPASNEDPMFYLLAGIAHWLARKDTTMTNPTTLPADERPIDSARELLHMLRVSPRHVTEATNDARVTQVCKRLLDLESDENSYTLTIEKLREETARLRKALEFYANKDNYYDLEYIRTGPDGDEMPIRSEFGGEIKHDLGYTARAALEKEPAND